MPGVSRRLLPFLLLTLLPCLLLPVGCTGSKKKSDKLQIVATYSILGDLVGNVVGDNADVLVLVGAGQDAHTFSPTAKDQMRLADADIIFENGIDFETWLDKTVKASRTKARRIIVTDGIKPMAMAAHDHSHGHDHKHEAGHDHGEFDPHVWHDVNIAKHMVQIIRDAVCRADPANAAAYRENAQAYVAQLTELDDWARKELAQVHPDRRKLVTSHDTYSYFGKQYDFKILGSALGSVSTEAADPSSKSFAKLVEEIKAAKVPAIFAENVSNPAIMERLAKEAGVKLGKPLYTDALGEPGSDGDTYVKMIRHNVNALVEGLK